ncbi:hypothetical protein MNBD_BACTEROID03-304 [hydrothermal vent metagenome]|uniref:Uncharacterized protein n=1 Tax=hydrothermal vent metagenome TaxID=652676 RepID=A0A3B0TCX0_9ZZZZ
MKKTLKSLTVFMFSFALLNVSCRQEESQLIEAPKEKSLKADSTVAKLLQRTAMNDGSGDNIIDNSSCFAIELPVVLKVNGLDILVDSEEDFDTIEDIFNEFDDDDDNLVITFPITIVLSDFTEITINSFNEFKNFTDDCSGENVDDDDIECADIKYPVTASIFNSNNELIDTITILNDKALYNFIDDLDEDDIVNVNFPIVAILSDGTEVETSNLNELENIIDNAKDDCDEDDDNDYNDDDCENCTTNQLSDVLTACSNWAVDDLERNDNDLEGQYMGYRFNFTPNGALSVTSGNNSFSGTWESNGSGNNISFTINIPDLPDFNATWILHEIEREDGETEVDFHIGEDNDLEFESNCTDG